MMGTAMTDTTRPGPGRLQVTSMMGTAMTDTTRPGPGRLQVGAEPLQVGHVDLLREGGERPEAGDRGTPSPGAKLVTGGRQAGTGADGEGPVPASVASRSGHLSASPGWWTGWKQNEQIQLEAPWKHEALVSGVPFFVSVLSIEKNDETSLKD
ncbi:hypothetical protein AAY473_039207 [Plecturocebus cupreus]